MARAGPRAFLALTLVLAVPLGLQAALSQSVDSDPRNTGEYFHAIDNNDCYACHQEFNPASVSIPHRYRVLPIGEPVDLEVRVRNPWTHQLFDLSLTVNASAAPGVDLLVAQNVTPPHTFAGTVMLTPTSEAYGDIIKVPVGRGASRVLVRAEVAANATAAQLLQAPFNLALDHTKRIDIRSGPGPHEILLEGDEAQRYGFGDFRARLWYSDQAPREIPVDIVVEVRYDPATTRSVTLTAPPETRLEGGQYHSFIVPVVARTDEAGLLDFAVIVRSHFDHSSGHAIDDGHYKRFTTLQTRGGATAQVLSLAGPAPVGPSVDLFNLLTRVVGFLALLIVPFAVITGGALGRGSRRALNRLVGGPQRRVLFHIAMSWGLIVFATLHLGLALYEQRSPMIVGVVWGGAGWALLVSLGATGLLQTRMVRRWGYRRWRILHLVPALFVPVFGLLHTVVDGTDLGALREALPWLQRLAV